MRIIYSFGGGSEMMRDGDVDGLWHLLEAGQRFEISFLPNQGIKLVNV